MEDTARKHTAGGDILSYFNQRLRVQLRINNVVAKIAGNAISELLDFKIFWGSMPPDPTREKPLTSQNQSSTKKLIETPPYSFFSG